MQNIPLDAYKIFCVVARSGSITSAAKELYITQPAVSMAVKQLETHLGKPLFNRTAKGVTLTAEGEVLYGYLSQAMDMIETAEEKYRAMVNLRAGEVKIGAGDTILGYYLLPFIERFATEHPGIAIKATNRTTNETVKSLRAGKVDVGFVNLPLGGTDSENDLLDITACMEIHDCLVGGAKYEKLARQGLKLTELKNYPLMLLENDSNSRRYLNAEAQKRGVTLNPGIELGSYDLLLRFAEINLGLTFAVREFLPQQNNLLEIPLIPEIPGRHIGFVTNKGVVLSSAAGAFMRYFNPA